MKTFFTFLLTMIGIMSYSFAQTYTDYPPGQRDPTFYYWDSNWVDVKGTCLVTNTGMIFYKTSHGRYCYTDSSLRVIGIAAAIVVADDTTKDILPEYFQLYEIGDSCDLDLRLLAEARWDTVIPHKRIGFCTYMSNEDYYPVYEVYFDKPYIVADSFYVVCTGNSNFRAQNERGYVTQPYRGHALIRAFDAYSRWWQEPPYIIRRSYEPTYDPNTLWNMKWARCELESKDFLAIFPIFDTTGMYRGGGTVHDTTCLQEVRGLSVLDVNAESTTLMWDSEGQTVWEVSYGHSGTPADSGTILNTTSSITTLEGLDTSSWYVAYVRSICPNSAPGAWSDSVRFYVPADTTHRIEPTGTPSLISLYTQIMPNPAKDEVMVISSFSISQIEVFSLAGKLLDSFDYGNVLQARLRVDSYPSGAYFIRVHTPSGTTTKKLIIR